ncbi:MAG TPA: DUF2911 domain-containing protein [Candidatus Acidoferrum sp.]|nr:DUF2911 domain-containing protein [Candidatus Acidoferrum sp.]
MNPRAFCSVVTVASGLLLANDLSAQTSNLEFPAPSPTSTLKQRVGLTDIEIVYSRPGKKDRAIFGGLVPYGEVWRTGANASTKISFSTAVKLNGQEVPAGKYALYTIPGETAWTIIIYKNPNLSGAFNYDPKDDLVRFKTEPVDISESVETFTIDVGNIKDDSAMLYLLWDHTLVPVKLEVDVVPKLAAQIDAAMAASEGQKPYYQAAMFYYDHELDLQKARKWVDAAAKERETYYILHLKAKILARLGEKGQAIAAAKRSSELAIKDDGPKSGYVKMNQDLISSLQQSN